MAARAQVSAGEQAPRTPTPAEAAAGAEPEPSQEISDEPAREVASQTPPAAVTEAAQRYDRGLKLHAEGEYSLAAIEFERAYALVPNYRALYNIGQVRIQLGQYARAHKALTQYLREGTSQIPEDRRHAVEADLEMIASRTGTLNVRVDVAGAEIFVDDVMVARAPVDQPLLIDAGEHSVTARRAGYHPRTVQITLAGRDSVEVKLALERQAPQAERIIVKERVAESNRDAWLWGTWTATGVFAVASGVTGGLGVKAAGDLEDKRSELGASRSELDSASRRSRTLLLAADVFGAMTILAGGAAVYVTLSKPGPESGVTERAGKPPRRQVALAFKPSWVGVTGTY